MKPIQKYRSWGSKEGFDKVDCCTLSSGITWAHIPEENDVIA